MNRPLIEWLNDLPEPIRSEALSNTCVSKHHIGTPLLSNALYCAFTWSCTPQGGKYWARITDRASGGEFNKPEFDSLFTAHGLLL